MGIELLLQDLRRKSEDRLDAIRRRAESEAAALRAEQEKGLAAARELMAGEHAAAEREAAEPIIRTAEIDALRIRDEARRQMADRLAGTAREMLAEVCSADYPKIFAGLAAELPDLAWSVVRINPRDLALARRHFPGAEIETDPAITGGFVALREGGRHRVVNTLERRLERAWPYLLPELLREVEEGLDARPAD
ncbi:MAG: V-type ATP synthase subunit E [Desulfobulbaceae bacterium]